MSNVDDIVNCLSLDCDVKLNRSQASRLGSYVKKLESDNAALAAQIESFKKAIKAIENDLIECSYDDESGYFVGIDSISDACDLANYAAPQQHLAEIRAEAVKDFARALSNTVQIPNGPMTRVDYYKAAIRHAIQFAEQYAAKVRQGR